MKELSRRDEEDKGFEEMEQEKVFALLSNSELLRS
jgi:hypothetical protein